MRKCSNRKCVDAFRQYLSPIALLPSSNLSTQSETVIKGTRGQNKIIIEKLPTNFKGSHGLHRYF
jgi:hypothetical protein